MRSHRNSKDYNYYKLCHVTKSKSEEFPFYEEFYSTSQSRRTEMQDVSLHKGNSND